MPMFDFFDRRTPAESRSHLVWFQPPIVLAAFALNIDGRAGFGQRSQRIRWRLTTTAHSVVCDRLASSRSHDALIDGAKYTSPFRVKHLDAHAVAESQE